MEKRNILEALHEYALMYPNETILSITDPKDTTLVKESITYHALFQSAYQLSLYIKSVAPNGSRALLCFPNGIEFVTAFYACLLAKVIAVPVIVPTNLGLIKKFSAITQDCCPKLLLMDTPTFNRCRTSHAITKYAEEYAGLSIFQDGDEGGMQLVKTDALIPDATADIRNIELPQYLPEELAFLQYTSGSTSIPKGVMISHGNLTDNLFQMKSHYERSFKHVVFSWLPHTHDMGLIGVILLCIQSRSKLYLSQPSAFIRDPISWLRALSFYKATDAACPCFALKMCLDKLTVEQTKNINLSALQSLIVGSEPIVHSVVKRFFAALAATGLREEVLTPSYGLAESTLMVSTRLGLNIQHINAAFPNTVFEDLKPVHLIKNGAVISCGKPSQTLKIVSPESYRSCPEQTIGEIWLRGDSIAAGYWNNIEDTKTCFQAQLKDDNQSYFRTGDLGFLQQGELYITGRLKELIIINGMNYCPHDIEQTALSCDPIFEWAQCVAFPYRETDSATDSFVLLIKSNQRLNQDIQESLKIKVKKSILKDYQLVPHDICFINQALPKTTSGKIQRNACEAVYKNHQERFVKKLSLQLEAEILDLTV